MAGRSKEPTETVSHGTIRLPNEIVDQICMQQRDVQTLRTLRLLDRTWNTAATKSMFSHLDVSLDIRSLMKLEFIAFGPLAKLVQSMRFREPQKVSSIGYESDDEEDEYHGGFDAHDSGMDLERYTRISSNFAIDDNEQITKFLTRSMRKLSGAKVIEFTIKDVIKCLDDTYDENLRHSVFESLRQALPSKLVQFVFCFRDKAETQKVCRIHELAVQKIFDTVSDVDIQISEFWRDGHYEIDTGGLWKVLATHGSQLKRVKLRHGGRPWVVEKGLTYNFAKLRSIELSNIEFDNSDFFKAIGATSSALELVVLSHIRLCKGRLSEIFDSLKPGKSTLKLELRQIMHEQNWFMHNRIRDKCGEENFPHWLQKIPRVWSMVCTETNQDLWACRDLLLAVNDNRRRAGLEPAFRAATDMSHIQNQSEWLLKATPNEDITEPTEGDFWADGSGNWDDELWSTVWSKYPLVTSPKDYMERLGYL